MSSIKMQMEGLDELRKTLQQLPEHLIKEASDIVIAHAELAQREVQDAYPVRTTNLHPTARRRTPWFPPGNLKARVRMVKNRAVVFTSAVVQSRAPHAWLYENGTKGRPRKTDKGWNRGPMPEAPLDKKMIPRVMRIRARMIKALIELVERAGLEVHQS